MVVEIISKLGTFARQGTRVLLRALVQLVLVNSVVYDSLLHILLLWLLITNTNKFKFIIIIIINIINNILIIINILFI